MGRGKLRQRSPKDLFTIFFARYRDSDSNQFYKLREFDHDPASREPRGMLQKAKEACSLIQTRDFGA